MSPILFQLGNISVRSYTVLLDLGLLAGLALVYILWRKRGLALSALLDAVTFLVIGGVVGGRAAYVALHWTYFSEHVTESLAIWTGGISFHGAFAGACLALLAYAGLSRQPFWQLADLFSSGLALGGIFGWLACFSSGCAYGIVGAGALFVLSPDIYGIEAPRFASQLAGAAQSAVILAISLSLLKLRTRPGAVFSTYLLLYFGGQFALEFLRGDEAVYIGMWRITQIADALLVLFGFLSLLLVRYHQPELQPGLQKEETARQELPAMPADPSRSRLP